MEVPQKTKNRTTIWSSNSTPGHIARKEENSNSERYTHPNVHSSTIYNSQDMEAMWMSINRWVDKEDVVHIYNGILFSHKQEWNNAICSYMDGPRDDHTKWNKSERERQISYDITDMWNLKKMIQINFFTKQKLTHQHRKQKGKGGGGIN